MLFDLSCDPGEQENLFDSHPIARRTCEIYLREGSAVPNKRRRLTDAGGTGGARRLRSRPAVLDPRLRRELEAMGYIR